MIVQHSEGVLYMAMELSSKTWKLRFGDGSKVRDKSLDAGDQPGLLDEVAKAKDKFGLPADARVMSCYEAGRDGFWIHRFLEKNDIENLVVDPASIEVNRRKRRAKTDRLDVKKLLIMLLRYCLHGEDTVWRICRVPDEQAEDQRRPGRELDRLTKERTAHSNRIRSLLVTQGVTGVQPARVDLAAVTDWEGKPLPPALLDELQRQQQRLRAVNEDMRQLRAARDARIVNPVTEADRKARKLHRLAALGEVSSWTLSKEMFGWRAFDNRRQVGAAAGLTGTPYDSGDGRREQGISKAGNRWVRKTCIELGWSWLRYQPQSALSVWYAEKFGGGGKRMRRVGIVALARKLLVALWKYVEHDQMPEGAVFRTTFVR